MPALVPLEALGWKLHPALCPGVAFAPLAVAPAVARAPDHSLGPLGCVDESGAAPECALSAGGRKWNLTKRVALILRPARR